MLRLSALSLVLVVTLVAADVSALDTLYTLASPNPEPGGLFGADVRWAGDVNGDGNPDVIVAAPYEDPGQSPINAGRAYVFSGATGDTLLTLRSPNEEYNGSFGWPVSGIGDVDGDGRDDLVVGAHDEDPGTSPSGAGRAYVFSGATGDTLYTLVSPNEEPQGCFGAMVSRAGDVNGDGYGDVAVGASRYGFTQPQGEGRAYVFDGPTGALVWPLESPSDPTGYFGNSITAAGDVNGDGFDDVVVGAWREDPDGRQDAGRAYVFGGGTGRPPTFLHTLVSPNSEVGGYFGCICAGAGDVDGDGHDDIVVGAYAEDAGGYQDAGRAYVFSGATGAPLYTLVSSHAEPAGEFGFVVSPAGDVNGNGRPDLIVGAHKEDPGSSPTDAGRAYVFKGAAGALLDSLVSRNEQAFGYFGTAVAWAGDLNKDGFDDVIVGAPSESDAGRAYVFKGEPVWSAPDGPVSSPFTLSLEGPFPNPSDGVVRLAIRLPDGEPRMVSLGLYDAAGRRVQAAFSGMVGEGRDVTWSAPASLAPGIYWWRLESGHRQAQRAMVLTK